MICKTCNGMGAVRYVYPSNRPIPCFWFVTGATPCHRCDGTGEVD